MKLYNKNGYADMHSIINIPVPFILCIGGRGTGKTYGAFVELLDNYQPFIYLRLTARASAAAGFYAAKPRSSG